MKKPHRATGVPRGRPPSLSFDLGYQILAALERRMDPATRTVRLDWKGNEYVELAKLLSTPASGSFVNGMLDTIVKDMTSQGRIEKEF